MRTIGPRQFELAQRLRAVLVSEPDVVSQQMAIELLTAIHAMRFGTTADANFVADAMHKHIKQMMEIASE